MTVGTVISIVFLGLLILFAAWKTANHFQKGGGCCGEHEQSQGKTGAQDRNKAHYPWEVTVKIGGMTCENCAAKVENALNQLDGVWAKVSISSHSARVLCKTPPDEASLRQAVQQAGYVVTRVQRTNE